MIERREGKITLICDECNIGLGTELSDYDDVKEYALNHGWLLYKRDEANQDRPANFVHICKDCANIPQQ